MSNSNSDHVHRVRAVAPELAEHAEAIRRLGKRVLSDVVEIGERLTKARALIAHGNWGRWLETEFGWSDATARRFVDIYQASKSDNLSNLDVPLSALYALARVPKEIRDEVIAEVEERSGRGEKPKVATIHEI